MGPALLLLTLAPLLGQPEGLLFHASFDQLTTTADFARGSGRSTLTANLEIRSAEGIRGAGLLQRPDERCSYPIAGNLNTSQGSFAIWVKPLSWEGKSRKFRHLLVATPSKAYTMMVYLYPIGDEAVFNYLSLDSGQPTAATWRAGAPVEMLRKGEWTHIVSTWGPTEVKLYANGRRVGEGRVGAPLPRLETGDFTICPVDWWRHRQWGDPEEQTICDEARIYDHPLSDEEVLDLYASELPGGLAELKPKLAVALRPDYARRTITATLRGAHLDAATQAALPAPARLALQDPRGNSCYDNQIPLTAGGAERTAAEGPRYPER
ncbi:MAG: LamG domain-containing protein [Armatimonadetes bacterium]|nr:LamG domain-containing protein [Armatimonadota bacterium]